MEAPTDAVTRDSPQEWPFCKVLTPIVTILAAPQGGIQSLNLKSIGAFLKPPCPNDAKERYCLRSTVSGSNRSDGYFPPLNYGEVPQRDGSWRSALFCHL